LDKEFKFKSLEEAEIFVFKKGLMNILGYTDKFSYKVGEKIPCKVSSINNIDYKVDLVKIIQGDINFKGTWL